MEEYADYYDELYGDEDDNEDEDEDSDDDLNDHNIDKETATKGMRREHCLPVLKWLEE